MDPKVREIIERAERGDTWIPISDALMAAVSCGLVEQVPGVAECRFQPTELGRIALRSSHDKAGKP